MCLETKCRDPDLVAAGGQGRECKPSGGIGVGDASFMQTEIANLDGGLGNNSARLIGDRAGDLRALVDGAAIVLDAQAAWRALGQFSCGRRRADFDPKNQVIGGAKAAIGPRTAHQISMS